MIYSVVLIMVIVRLNNFLNYVMFGERINIDQVLYKDKILEEIQIIVES